MSKNEEKIVNEIAKGNLDNENTLPTDPIERAEYAAALSDIIEGTFQTKDEITLSVTDATLCSEALRVLHVYLHHAAALRCFMHHVAEAVPMQWTPPQASAA